MVHNYVILNMSIYKLYSIQFKKNKNPINTLTYLLINIL